MDMCRGLPVDILELPDRQRGKMRRSMDVVKEEIQGVAATEQDTDDRERWKRMISCGII